MNYEFIIMLPRAAIVLYAFIAAFAVAIWLAALAVYGTVVWAEPMGSEEIGRK